MLRLSWGARWVAISLRMPSPSSLQDLQHGAAECRGGVRDDDTGAPHRIHLVGGGSGAAGDDGAGVPHAAARRSGDTGDEAYDGFLHIAVLDEVRGLFHGGTADLADHDDRS